MSWLDLPRTDALEEIDDPDQPYGEVAEAMADVARANRAFWGTRTVVQHVSHLLRAVPRGTPVRILDIATGSADIPQALAQWGRSQGYHLQIVALDNLPSMVRMAQETHPAVSLVRADALSLPFAPRSFDIALCALAFHHFGFDLSVRVLRAMDSLTTRGFIVSDLRRDWLSLLTVQTGLALLGSHPMTRHDGSISVRRAYTLREYEKMVALSGAQGVRLTTHGYVRVALTQDKGKCMR